MKAFPIVTQNSTLTISILYNKKKIYQHFTFTHLSIENNQDIESFKFHMKEAAKEVINNIIERLTKEEGINV